MLIVLICINFLLNIKGFFFIIYIMDEEIRKRLEYEEQFFEMSSKFFSDCFKKLVQDEIVSKINMLVGDVKEKLFQQTKNTEKFQTALDKMKEDLTELYNKALEDSFPEIESNISKFIHIPPSVLLKEDLPIKSAIKGNLDEIKEEITNLKGTFSSLLYLKHKMLEELEEADSAIIFMEHVVKEGKLNFNILPVEEICAFSKEGYAS